MAENGRVVDEVPDRALLRPERLHGNLKAQPSSASAVRVQPQSMSSDLRPQRHPEQRLAASVPLVHIFGFLFGRDVHRHVVEGGADLRPRRKPAGDQIKTGIREGKPVLTDKKSCILSQIISSLCGFLPYWEADSASQLRRRTGRRSSSQEAASVSRPASLPAGRSPVCRPKDSGCNTGRRAERRPATSGGESPPPAQGAHAAPGPPPPRPSRG